MKTDSDKPYYAFQEIPYAAPPVGRNRFQVSNNFFIKKEPSEEYTEKYETNVRNRIDEKNDRQMYLVGYLQAPLLQLKKKQM